MWVMQYDNLHSVSIDKEGNFKIDKYKGQFVLYGEGNNLKKCLKIYKSWTVDIEKGQYELGWRSASIKDMYSGKFAIASTQELDPSELQRMSSKDLKIMRNEIFARYGYRFKKDGEMDQYFSKQSWYRPQHSNVSNFLTDLEKRNIQLIKKEEQKP